MIRPPHVAVVRRSTAPGARVHGDAR
jgi:hypothetical protein